MSDNIQKLVNETLTTTEEYIKNAIPLIDNMGKNFYNGPDEKNWNTLTDLFEGLTWIIETLIKIDSVEKVQRTISEYEVWDDYIKSVSDLNVVIPELEEGLEDKDSIIIGYLLLSKINPIFEDMLKKIEKVNYTEE